MTTTAAACLPDDVVFSIFSHLGNPLYVARCESVCRQWHDVARSHASLWRDALNIDGDSVPETSLFCRRIDELRIRSGGTLDRIAVRLGAEASDSADMIHSQHLATLIPRVNAKELWIECCETHLFKNRSGPRADRITRFWSNAECFTTIADAVVAAMGQCTNLHSLYFAGIEAIAPIFKQSFGEMPLSQCRLTHLELRCDLAGALFDDDSLFDMLRHAKRITLLFRRSPLPKRHLWRLLEQASETLEYVEAYVDLLADRTPQAIILPRLASLLLRCQPPRHYQIQCDHEPGTGELVCPALRELAWPQGIADDLFVPLLSPQLDTLLFTMARATGGALEETSQRTLSLIGARCTNLRELQVSRSSYKCARLNPTQLASLSAQQFVFVYMDLFDADIVKLVQARQSSGDAALHRPITSIRIAQIAGMMPEPLEWLRSNVDEVDVEAFHGDRARTLEEEYALQRTCDRFHALPLLQRRPPAQ